MRYVMRYPFTIECVVYRRPNMRNDNLEMEMYMGRNILDGCFDRMEIMPKVTSLYLSFPERWLNIVEERQLYDRLALYCPNLRSLKLKTQSVYIIQCTPSGCLFIVNDEIPADQSDLTIKQYTSATGAIINMNKLNVLNGGE